MLFIIHLYSPTDVASNAVILLLKFCYCVQNNFLSLIPLSCLCSSQPFTFQLSHLSPKYSPVFSVLMLLSRGDFSLSFDRPNLRRFHLRSLSAHTAVLTAHCSGRYGKVMPYVSTYRFTLDTKIPILTHFQDS